MLFDLKAGKFYITQKDNGQWYKPVKQKLKMEENE